MTKFSVTPWRKFWASLNGTTGHTHSGVDGQGPSIAPTITGDIEIPIDHAIIVGSETTDGSYKFVIDGEGFQLKKRISGNWENWARWDP